MTRAARTSWRVMGAALAALLTLGVLATPSGAIITYQTISGSAQCPPGSFQCFALFTDGMQPARLATTTPVVVQTGALPANGPGLPVSLLTGQTGDVGGGSGEQGFLFRVFDQNGAAASTTTQSFFHASVSFADGARAAGSAVVFTNGAGEAIVNFTRRFNRTPLAVIVTGRSPYSGLGLPVNLVTHSYTTTGFTVRALDQAGAPIANSGIRVHYWATSQAVTPNTRAGQAVVTPNERGFATIAWPMLAVGLPPVSVVLTGISPRSGPDMPVNLLAAGPGSAGVRARILDQSGQPITVPVRIAYYATKRAASEI
jgi:hypothetical protein